MVCMVRMVRVVVILRQGHIIISLVLRIGFHPVLLLHFFSTFLEMLILLGRFSIKIRHHVYSTQSATLLS